MMARYIDADLIPYTKEEWACDDYARRYDIEEVPTADVEPVVHGRWIEEKKQTLIPVEFDDAGEPVLHDYVVYRCDQCGRTAGKKEPYCHCGAKMDLNVKE